MNNKPQLVKSVEEWDLTIPTDLPYEPLWDYCLSYLTVCVLVAKSLGSSRFGRLREYPT